MKTCVNCGRLLDDNAILCPGCAAFQPLPPDESRSFFTDFFLLSGPEEDDEDTPAVRQARKYLVWSIVLLFFCSFFGFPGLFASLQAMSAQNAGHRHRLLGFARGFCIAGTILAALFVAFTFYLVAADPSLLSRKA